ncbi:MAG: glycosyltransferase [Lachnospiraceae bacterium]|nr:glycosyltransferase [Lachnospiraceae bacterium]
MQTLVSIVVPAYNVEKYIARCLDSLCVQTYQKLQIIVVDDGSTDATGAICDAYKENDERILVIHQANKGVSVARNLGLSQAKGEYCAFVDGDDYIDDYTIETAVKALEDSNADCVNFAYRKVDETGKIQEVYTFLHGMQKLETEEQKLRFLLDRLLCYRVGYEVWDKLFRMDIIKNQKLEFTQDCKMGEDLGFVMRYCLYAKSMFCMEGQYYNYVIRENSAMGQADVFEKNMEGYICFLKGVYDTLERESRLQFLRSHYPLLFAKAMENPVRGHSISEITQVIGELSYREFYLEQIKEIATMRKCFRENYGSNKWKNVWRSYVALEVALTKGTRWKRIYLWVYNWYRRLRYGEVIDTMKQP